MPTTASLVELRPGESRLLSPEPSPSTSSFHHADLIQLEDPHDSSSVIKEAYENEDRGRSDEYSIEAQATTAQKPTSSNQNQQHQQQQKQTFADDSAVEDEPMSQVDYLSHSWKEEDIWSSWRYVKSRKHDYKEFVRLENASWRSWIQKKNGLGTIPPETLDWYKDCDVTWLYGPLKPYDNRLQVLSPPESPPSSPYKWNSAASHEKKKSILKKKSVSQAILQRSCCLPGNGNYAKNDTPVFVDNRDNDLLNTAAPLDRSSCDKTVPGLAFDSMSSLGDVSETSSVTTNSISAAAPAAAVAAAAAAPPPAARRHISFNNEVAQCIAVDGEPPGSNDYLGGFDSCVIDDDDDDNGVSSAYYGMYRRNWDYYSPFSSGASSPGSYGSSSESRTIAMLPSTTLKPAPDLPSDVQTQLSNTSISSFYPFSWWPLLSMPGLQKSASVETLRPISPPPSPPSPPGDIGDSSNGSDDNNDDYDDIDDDNENEEEEEDDVPSAQAFSIKAPNIHSDKGQKSRYPLLASPAPNSQEEGKKDLVMSLSSAILSSLNFYGEEDEEGEEEEEEGVAEEMEQENEEENSYYPDDVDYDGESDKARSTDYKVVDQILDTVNTARDIAHVIWNIGWRD